MSTVGKAIRLMFLFTERTPELGLTELARGAGFDKATTRRLLMSLAEHGLIEHNPMSRRYRLGSGLLGLARIRESTFPLAKVAEPILKELAGETGETVHLTELAGSAMITLLAIESERANRVSLGIGEQLPLHCTAPGIAVLAFGGSEAVNRLLVPPFRRYTAHTLVDLADIEAQIKQARRVGFAIGDRGYEDDVFGMAAPIFDSGARAVAAVGTATPFSRVTDRLVEHHSRAVRGAARSITLALGGRPPEALGDDTIVAKRRSWSLA